MSRMIGIDLDNTIVSYDSVIRTEIVRRRLLSKEPPQGKKALRDLLRHQEGGEEEWQKIQAVIYGEKMHEAVAFPGVLEFLLECRRLSIPVCVISHKTQRAAQQRNGPSLRKAAIHWLEQNGFLRYNQTGLSPDRVFFESTRQGKIEKIREMECTDFVDDLREVLEAQAFPESVRRVLFDPSRCSGDADSRDFHRAATWSDDGRYLLSQSTGALRQ